MKRHYFFVICLLFSGISAHIFGLDLKVSGGLGNNAFDPARELPLEADVFDPHYYPRILVDLKGEVSNLITFGACFERDPILRNRLIGTMGLNAGYVHLDMGPMVGIFNSGTKSFNPGISAAIRLEIPGILYGAVSTASTIGANLNIPGSYIHGEGEAALGVWAPYVLTVFSFRTRTYTESTGVQSSRSDEQTRYQLGTEIFSKNMPYTIHVDIGYQSLQRNYTEAGVSSTDELRSVYVGLEGTFTINPMLKVLAGLEAPVYSWGAQPLKPPPANTMLFDAHAGVEFSFP
jgi:hypothetical protein